MRSNLPAAIISRSLSAIAASAAVILALAAPGTVLVTSAVLAVLASAGLSGVMSLSDGGGRSALCGFGTAFEIARADWAEAPEVAVSARAAASAVPASS